MRALHSIGIGVDALLPQACRRCNCPSCSSALKCSFQFVPPIVTMFFRFFNVDNKKPPLVPFDKPPARRSLLSPGKGYSMLRMVYSFTPPGVETITRSPTLWPNSDLPTGDSLEISPELGFASNAPTIV